MNPLISIIVPVYKVEKYLDRCVESIVNQTYKNLEIILVDDGSPDNCPAMCESWAKKDNRIKVLHIENKGVANARNIGLDTATGDYVGFVDSDDYIESDMFEKLLGNMLKLSADISVCGYQINDEDRGEDDLRTVSQSDGIKLICTGDYKYGVLWNKLYKKAVIDRLRMPHLVCCEDLAFNYYVFKNAISIAECNSRLYHYFENDESTVHHEFSIGAFDAVKSKQIMLKDTEGTEFAQYAVRGFVSSSFVVLSGCIQSDAFPDDAKKLIDGILKYKKQIMKSDLYSKADKIKTLVLSISPKLYYHLIKRKYKNE